MIVLYSTFSALKLLFHQTFPETIKSTWTLKLGYTLITFFCDLINIWKTFGSWCYFLFPNRWTHLPNLWLPPVLYYVGYKYSCCCCICKYFSCWLAAVYVFRAKMHLISPKAVHPSRLTPQSHGSWYDKTMKISQRNSHFWCLTEKHFVNCVQDQLSSCMHCSCCGPYIMLSTLPTRRASQWC